MYVVTGLPRSGTSMLMRCLAFAGIKPVVNSAREEAMQRWGTAEYRPNPYGFYESVPGDYLRVGFLKELPDNSAIKLPTSSLAIIPARPTTAIWMHRNEDEVRASMKAAFNREPDSVEREAIQREILEDRKSVTIVDLNYRDVVKNPAKALSFLPQSAVNGVDAKLYRHGNV